MLLLKHPEGEPGALQACQKSPQPDGVAVLLGAGCSYSARRILRTSRSSLQTLVASAGRFEAFVAELVGTRDGEPWMNVGVLEVLPELATSLLARLLSWLPR